MTDPDPKKGSPFAVVLLFGLILAFVLFIIWTEERVLPWQ